MNPTDFIRKWEKSTLKESAAAQSHFNDLCDLLDEPKPTDVDQTGETYCFEKGATKSTGGNGFADVWKKGCFGWEYKGPHKDLDRAHDQLLRYSVALENPPLLIVSDTKKIIIRTNWTNTIQEHHEIALTDLVDAAKRDLLKAAFSNPESLKPKRTRTQLTADAADEFSELAQRLRARRPDGEDEQDYARKVAHFVNRLVFCMFAEDVDLLPNKMFQKAMEMAERSPEKAQGFLQQLFAAMKDGGAVGFEEIPWFNGGLFDSDEALPMDRDDVALALKAAKLDWQDIDPSILGTLFERGLDPSKRSQLGAHYTDRDKIMMIVNPVIVEPLTKEWEETKAKIEKLIAGVPEETKEKLLRGKELAARTKALNSAEKLHKAFIDRLKVFRVLDPACGSGNFLYLSLLALKDLEHKANLDAETLGLPRAFPQVGPEAVKGIEINPYAAELARVSIWIGEIQWMRRNGFSAHTNPILRPLGNIECRDALIEQMPETGEWCEAQWPDADVIVGNPPFLGAKWMLDRLGDDYVRQLRTLVEGKGNAIDLVVYWFLKAADKIRHKTKRVGFVATNMIRSPANSFAAEALYDLAPISFARSDEPWVVDGADVRVSIIVCDVSQEVSRELDSADVAKISSTLKGFTFDLSEKHLLKQNLKKAVRGIEKGGPFEIARDEAIDLIDLPRNPNGNSNADVVKPYLTVREIIGRPTDKWIIDFFGKNYEAASLYEAPFALIKKRTPVARAENRESRTSKNWWLFRRTGETARAAINSKSRLLVTGLVTKYRVFRWASPVVIPDTRVIIIDSEADTVFGILSGKFHEVWTLANCQYHGVGNDPVYTPSDCFETFPFPKGLTPNIPAADYANDPRAQAIAAAAASLNELRENWLNPPDLVKRVPEVVEGYPDRILPVDEKAEKILKKRTLTNLYNERPAWLDNAHRALDAAVAAAYGWEEDFRSGKLTDEEILKRLFELNQDRAKKQEG